MPMVLIALLLQSASAADPNCGGAGADVEIAQCWDRAAEQADVELNRIWPGILKSARDQDSAFEPTQRRAKASAADDLKIAQRAWLKFRQAQCDLESDQAQGGSLEPILQGECHAKMTRTRIKQLLEIAEGFREG